MSAATRRIRPWRGSSLVFAAELLLLPTGLITAGFLTRQLGAEGYGLFTLVATTVGWLQWIANSVLSRAAHRQVAAATEWRPVAAEVIRLHLQVGAAMGVALFLLAPLLANALRQPSIALPLRILSADVLLYALACGHRNVLIGTNDHGPWALGAALRWTVRLMAIVFFVQLGWSVAGAVLGLMTANAAELVVGRIRIGHLERASRDESLKIRRALLAIVAPVALAAVALRTFDRADILLLSVLGTDAAALGLYGAAQNLTVIVSLVASSVSPAILAAVVGLRHSGNESGSRRVASDALRLPFLMMPFTALAAGSSPEILRTIYGASFAAAAPYFTVLMLAAGMLLVVSVCTALLVAADRAWLVVLVGIPMLMVQCTLALLLVPTYGSVGAAMATLVAASAGALASLVATVRLARVTLSLRSPLVGMAMALPAYLAAQAWPAGNAPQTIIKLLALSVSLALVLLAAGELRYFRTTFASSTTSG